MTHAFPQIRSAILLSGLTASVLGAQANIPQLRGDVGLGAGTQAPPGLYAGVLFNNYASRRVVTADGAPFSQLRPIINAVAVLTSYSSEYKVLGGRWSATIAVPWVDIGLAAPNLDLQSSWGLSDMYLLPLQLGWHFPNGTLLVGQGLFWPTGRYQPGATDNTGLGMWSWESTLGGTLYLNESRQLNFSTLASYQVQSHVSGTAKRPGQVLTLEGGLGHAIAKGYGLAGVAYYARFKTTSDQN
jgi:hypothetical protein